MLFSAEMRPQCKEENPEASITDMARILGAQWKSLSEEEKLPYEAKVAEDKERYLRECEEAGVEPKGKKEKVSRRRRHAAGWGGWRTGRCLAPLPAARVCVCTCTAARRRRL